MLEKQKTLLVPVSSRYNFPDCLQVIVNVSVVTKVFPTTGITLPFISYGGSSLIVNMFCCGILINISKNTGITVGEIK